MRPVRMAIVSLTVVMLAAILPGDDNPKTGHPAVVAAREKFDRQVSAALAPLRTRYVNELQTLKKTLERQNDAKGVSAVETELQVLEELALPHERHPLTGTWQVKYTNGAVRTYRINHNGAVFFVEDGKSAQITRLIRDYVLDFSDGKIERLTLEPAIIVEHFDPRTTYPDGPPRLEGHGTRAAE